MVLPILSIPSAIILYAIFLFIYSKVAFADTHTNDFQMERMLGNVDPSGASIPVTIQVALTGEAVAGPWQAGYDFSGGLVTQSCATSASFTTSFKKTSFKICYSIFRGSDGYYLKDIYFYTIVTSDTQIMVPFPIATSIIQITGARSSASTSLWTVAEFAIAYDVYVHPVYTTPAIRGIMTVVADGSWNNNVFANVGGSTSQESGGATITIPPTPRPTEHPIRAPTSSPTPDPDILPRGRWVRVNKGRSQISIQYTVGYTVEEGFEDSIARTQSYARTTELSTSHEFSKEVYGEVTVAAGFLGSGVSGTVGFSATFTDGISQMVGYSSETSFDIGKSAFSSVSQQYSETVQVGCGSELGYILFVYEVEAPDRFKVIPKPIIAWCKKGSMAPVCPPSKCADDECTYCRSNTFKDPDFDMIMSHPLMGKRLQALDPDAPKTSSPTSVPSLKPSAAPTTANPTTTPTTKPTTAPSITPTSTPSYTPTAEAKSPATNTDPNMITYIGVGVGIPSAFLFLSSIVVMQFRSKRNSLRYKAQRESLVQARNPAYTEAANPPSKVTQLQSNQ